MGFSSLEVVVNIDDRLSYDIGVVHRREWGSESKTKFRTMSPSRSKVPEDSGQSTNCAGALSRTRDTLTCSTIDEIPSAKLTCQLVWMGVVPMHTGSRYVLLVPPVYSVVLEKEQSALPALTY